MPTVTTGCCSTQKGGVAFLAFGKGSNLLAFVHGLDGGKELFTTAADYVEEGIQGMSVDLLGYGDSEHLGKNQHYTFSIQAEALAEILLSQNAQSIGLVLHSMSSALLPFLSDELLSKTRAIFLMEGNLFENDAAFSRQLSEMDAHTFTDFFERLDKTSHFVLSQNLIQRLPWEQLYKMCHGIRHADSRAVHALAKELFTLSKQEIIAQIIPRLNIPIYYYRGITDQRIWQDEMRTASLKVKINKIFSAGHYPFLDQPERVYRQICVEFLTQTNKLCK